MMQKYIFIHIPKTGGLSIKQSLSDLMPPNYAKDMISEEYVENVKAMMNTYNFDHQFEHCRWRDLSEQYRNAYKAVAIIRNPWSRIVSRYNYAKYLAPEHYSTFEVFLEERHIWHKEYFWHRAIKGWYPQFDYVTDEDGNLKCDILRFEHYNEDTMNYFNLETPIQVKNIGIKVKYQDYYTLESKEIIADWYKKDIEFFDFTFDATATKNIWSQHVH